MTRANPHAPSPTLAELRERWSGQWEEALALWSRFTQLSPPRWFTEAGEEEANGLKESFAAIRLEDHVVMVSLRQLRERRLEPFALQVLAHEIGHHLLIPGDLTDHGRLLARTRSGLSGRETHAPLVANLFADLLINDRLHREMDLAMAPVYATLNGDHPPRDPLWRFTMRIYEVLWGLPAGSLAGPTELPLEMESDARLGARLVRVYSREWLTGAARFAVLSLPYLPQGEGTGLKGFWKRVTGDGGGESGGGGWLDTLEAGEGGLPDGLTALDPEEEEVLHPAQDPRIAGTLAEETPAAPPAPRRQLRRRNPQRELKEYQELLKAMGIKLTPQEMVIRYYRELARPHLVPFPEKHTPLALDPLPEGVDPWQIGDPLEEVDWVETLLASPRVFPGLTTRRRLHAPTPGSEPQRRPVDLYLGIDCSGSMPNPAQSLSHPVLGGVIITLSALRAGAKVMATLSGHPGRFASTNDFTRSSEELLTLLTSYLGTGYAFGIIHLEKVFAQPRPPDRPVHVMVVSDGDIFFMLQETPDGWGLIQRVLANCGGGGSMVLNNQYHLPEEGVARLRQLGWAVHPINGWPALIRFAREFSRRAYPGGAGGGT